MQKLEVQGTNRWYGRTWIEILEDPEISEAGAACYTALTSFGPRYRAPYSEIAKRMKCKDKEFRKVTKGLRELYERGWIKLLALPMAGEPAWWKTLEVREEVEKDPNRLTWEQLFNPKALRNTQNEGVKKCPPTPPQNAPLMPQKMPPSIVPAKPANTITPPTPQGGLGVFGFAEFKGQYPKIPGRTNPWKKVQQWFEKHKPSAELQASILAALTLEKNSEQWRRDGGRFIPQAITWLNQERWADALEQHAQKIKITITPKIQSEAHAAQLAALQAQADQYVAKNGMKVKLGHKTLEVGRETDSG